MLGKEGEWEKEKGVSTQTGIVGRALGHIFCAIADLRNCGWEFTVTCEIIEIYNETFRDLLSANVSLLVLGSFRRLT